MPAHYGSAKGKPKPIGGRKPLAGKPGTASAVGKGDSPKPPKKKQPAPTRLVIQPVKPKPSKRGK